VIVVTNTSPLLNLAVIGEAVSKRRIPPPRWGRIAVGHGVTRGYASLHPGLSTSMPSASRNETPPRGPTGADVDSPGWSGAQPRVAPVAQHQRPNGAHGAFATRRSVCQTTPPSAPLGQNCGGARRYPGLRVAPPRAVNVHAFGMAE